DLVDRVSQLAATPVFTAVNGTVGFRDQRGIALDHGRYLFALVRMNQEHDFIMAHCLLPMDWTAPRTSRWSKESLGSAATSHKPPQGRAILLHSPDGHKGRRTSGDCHPGCESVSFHSGITRLSITTRLITKNTGTHP